MEMQNHINFSPIAQSRLQLFFIGVFVSGLDINHRVTPLIEESSGDGTQW